MGFLPLETTFSLTWWECVGSGVGGRSFLKGSEYSLGCTNLRLAIGIKGLCA